MAKTSRHLDRYVAAKNGTNRIP